MKTIWSLPMVHLMPLEEIKEERQVAILTSAPAWKAVETKLNLRIAWKAEVKEATRQTWDRLGEDLQGEVVYAVGGGLPADAGKYLASKKGLELTCIPTALSVDAFLTWASGIRVEGCVRYLETKCPERLILDWRTIAAAPAPIRAAGICDVLSIATGSWDWKYAHEKKMNPPEMAFIPWVYNNAKTILDGVIECAEAAGAGDEDGLKTLFDCLAMEVQLCNQVGHARPEEGSEHYFAYCVENKVGHGLPHGDLLGPGIVIFARLQGQNVNRLEKALKACHVPMENIPEAVIQEALKELPAYVVKHNLPYGIAHEL